MANAPVKLNISILLVEDEKRLARSVERQLVRAGYDVEMAFDGMTASQLITSREFHLVLLDLTSRRAAQPKPASRSKKQS